MERMGWKVIAGKRLLRQGSQTPLLPSVTQLVKGFQRSLLICPQLLADTAVRKGIAGRSKQPGSRTWVSACRPSKSARAFKAAMEFAHLFFETPAPQRRPVHNGPRHR